MILSRLAAAFAAFSLAVPSLAGVQLPVGFVIEKIGTDWDRPVSVAFLSNGRMLVGEKRGRIWYLENDVKRNVVMDIELEVLNLLDRGLLCVTPDPQFDSNGYVYLLYAVDPEADGIDGNQEAYCRLERWTLVFAPNGDLVVDPASRFDLIGDVWATGIPSCHFSHSVGTVRFLSDGSLVMSCGDAAHYDNVDVGGQDDECFGPGRFSLDQDVGAFRSQYANTLAGKLLRIDPATGLGLPDNPWFDGDPGSIPSRTWAKGLRNPFRFGVMPGSGPTEALFVCDVGWNLWEEVNLARGGENFGWPCREGKISPQYATNDPLGFCNGMVETPPLMTWHHSISGQIGFSGNCASGAVVYTGTSYPPIYRNALFFCDYGKNWIKCAQLDANLNVTSIVPFGSFMDRPIDLQVDPASGDLVYTSFLGLGEIRRIRYLGNNLPPIAVATLAPTWGPSPLTIAFEAIESTDPEGGALGLLWDFGDGTTSTSFGDVHTFTDSVNHDVTLTLTDDAGNTTTKQWLVTPDNTPPQIVSITKPANAFTFHDGVPFEFEASVADVEDDASGVPIDVQWRADLIHDHHEHPGYSSVSGKTGSFTFASQGPGTHFEIVLTTTDSRGLAVSETLYAYDDDAQPAAHLVSVSDDELRLGQRVVATGHVEFPNTALGGPKPSLEFDWGDGDVDVYTGLRHQEDVVPTHDYAALGTYTLTLTTRLGTYAHAVTQTIDVIAAEPAVAIFTPILNQGFVEWGDQLSIAQTVRTTLEAKGVECEVFSFDDQDELVAWATPYLADGVQDVLIVIDAAPAALFAGENDGSLAELWVEHGNGLVWTGKEPFTEYLLANGTTSVVGAGGSGADKFFDVPLGSFACRGTGVQLTTPLGASEIPTLPSSWYADYALRLALLDPQQWRVGKLYAQDGADKESDAVLVRNVSGGFYAQLFAAADTTLDRTGALLGFLKSYATYSPWSPVVKPPPPGPKK